MKKIIALAALAAVSAGASASTNLFTDGSFESITQGSGTWGTYTSVPGWTVTKADGTASSHGLEIRNNVAGQAQDKNNFIELDGYENDKISQTLSTVIGQTYQISFWVQDRPDQTSSFLATSGGWALSVAGTAFVPHYGNLTVTSGTQSATGTFGTDWLKETFDFTAVSTQSKFSIWATGKSDSLGTSFDNFQAVAVPEPTTLGLFAAGLAVLGLSARRRKQQ